MSIGKALREARQRQGLNLKDLEETTKIRTHYLQALEEENFSELPGQTYVMGFIRTYARTLGIDAQELVDEYKSLVGEPEAVIKPMDPVAPPITRKAFPFKRGVIIGGLCVLAVLTLYGMDKAWKTDKNPAPSVESAAKTPGTVKPGTGNTQPQTTTEPPAQPSTQAPVQAAVSASQNTDELSLDLTLTDKCWFVVKADGQEVFRGTLTAGQTKNIKAKEKIEFPSIGNAGALQLNLNGKSLAPLGGSGVVVKNKTLTKADIPQ